jgi:hypothetical protein
LDRRCPWFQKMLSQRREIDKRREVR